MKQATLEQLVAEFGEEHRTMIQDALRFLKDHEPWWKLERPINRRRYVRGLVESAVLSMNQEG